MSVIGDVGKQLIGGRHSTSFARAGIKVEVTELKKLSKEMDVLRNTATSLRKEMDALGRSSAAAMNAARGGGYSGGGSRGGSRAQNGMPLPPPAPGSQGTAVNHGSTSALASAFGGRGSGVPGMGQQGMMSQFGGGGAAALAIGAVGGQMMGALDTRISRGANYAADLDRINVLLQQQTGRSQSQVMNQRKPLANYRLGADGINQLMMFQSQTGVQATSQQAQSIAGIRALSGYTKTTADVLQDQRSAMDPNVANRMFNMLGTNAYTTGGGVNDPMKMRQQITQSMGLTNESVLRSAKMPGSVTRARLADAGVPLELQDEILDYAQSNVQFQKKGGKGMYDPSKKTDRRRMGIEENFATQQEETDRLRGAREEDFSRRQLDNLASMERNTQTMVKLLGSIEDKLSGVIGARASNRGWMGMAGGVAKIAGAGIMAATGWTGVGLGVGATLYGAGALASGSAGLGDASFEGNEGGNPSGGGGASKSSSANDANIKVPVGYAGKRASLNEVKQRSDFRTMNPKMQERLLSMFRANPNVGIGGGSRNTGEQERLFRSRYRKTNRDTGIYWEGSYWEHISGAAAAPPGKSMHEIGLAADLIGDIGWMNANAGKFGLKHFAGVNNEPWHVQPAELPNSRSQYEKGGSQWGGGSGMSTEDPGSKPAITTGATTEVDSGHGGGGHGGGSGLRSFAGMSIAEIIDSVHNGGMGGGYNNNSGVKKAGVAGIGSTPMATPPSAGAISGMDVARAASSAGFSGDQLIKMVAIAKRESGWKPRAYNGNLGTGDQSYGLWQLNTLNKKGAGMMGDLFNQFLGKPAGNKDFDALFDPNTNARGAKFLSSRSGGTLNPWGGYKGKSDTYNADQYIAEATQAVKQAGLGDPMPSDSMGSAPSRGNSSVSLSHAPTYQITVAPQITFMGTPDTPDLKKIAQEVTEMLTNQVRTLEMRGA